MSDTKSRSDLSVVAELAVAARSPKHPTVPAVGAGAPYVVTRTGEHVERLDHLLPAPLDVSEAITLRDVASFLSYLERFKSSATRLFADRSAKSVLAILDYHGREESGPRPSWCRHQVTLRFAPTDEWRIWTGASGRKMSQVEFAEFLEDNLPDIADPKGAEVLETARTLESNRSVTFRSSVRLKDGTSQLRYEETEKTGAVEIPDRFVLGIAPYEGSDRFSLEARLRYRIEDGTLVLWFDLLRPQKVLDQVFADATSAIGEATSIPIWYGAR